MMFTTLFGCLAIRQHNNSFFISTQRLFFHVYTSKTSHKFWNKSFYKLRPLIVKSNSLLSPSPRKQSNFNDDETYPDDRRHLPSVLGDSYLFASCSFPHHIWNCGNEDGRSRCRPHCHWSRIYGNQDDSINIGNGITIGAAATSRLQQQDEE